MCSRSFIWTEFETVPVRLSTKMLIGAEFTDEIYDEKRSSMTFSPDLAKYHRPTFYFYTLASRRRMTVIIDSKV